MLCSVPGECKTKEEVAGRAVPYRPRQKNVISLYYCDIINRMRLCSKTSPGVSESRGSRVEPGDA